MQQTLYVFLCSRTVRRLFWYVLSAIFCVWSVMVLKHLDLESSRFFGLLLLSVRISYSQTACVLFASPRAQLCWPVLVAAAVVEMSARAAVA